MELLNHGSIELTVQRQAHHQEQRRPWKGTHKTPTRVAVNGQYEETQEISHEASKKAVVRNGKSHTLG